MTHRINTFIATMENYSNVLEYTEASQDSAGTSAEKYGAYMDSIEAKLNRLTAAWEQFVNNLNASGAFDIVVDAGMKIIEILDKLLNEMGLLKKLGIPVAIGLVANLLSSKLFTGLSTVLTAVTTLKGGAMAGASAVGGLAGAIGKVAAVAPVAAGAIGILVAIISAIVISVQEANRKIKESIELASDASNKYKDQREEIDKLTEKYTELTEKLKENRGNEEATKEIKSQLLEVQNQLNDAYDIEHEKLLLVNGAYEDQIEKIKELDKQSASDFVLKNMQAYNDAVKELDKTKTYNVFNAMSMGNTQKDILDRAELSKRLKDAFGDSLSILSSGDYTLELSLETSEDDLLKASKIIKEFSDETGRDLSAYLSKISGFINDIDTDLRDSSRNVKQQYEIALVQSDDEGSVLYENIQDYVAKYNEEMQKSIESGDFTALDSLSEKINEVMSQVGQNHPEWANVFNSVYEGIDQSLQGMVNFEKELQNMPVDRIEKLKSDLEGYSFDELKASGIEAFDELAESAEKYGLKAEDVIRALENLGIIQESISQDAPIYFENFNDILSNFAKTANSVANSYSTLTSAVDEFNTYGAISADTLASLADNNLLQYLDVLDGKLVLNADALVASAEAERAKAIETVKANAFAKLSALALEQEAEASEEAEIAAFNTSVQVSGAAKAFADFITPVTSATEALARFSILSGQDIPLSKMDEANQIVDNMLDSINLINSLSFEGLEKSARSAASSANDKLKEMLETAKELQKVLEDERKDLEDFIETAMKMVEQEYKDIEENLEKQKDAENERYDAWKDNLDRQKEEKDRWYDDEIQRLEDLRDAEKDIYKDRIDALKEEIDAYEKKIDTQKKLLEAQKEEEDYQKSLAEKTKDVAKIQSELAKLQFDDSIEAQKKKIELTEQLAEKQSSLDDYQSDHAYDLQKDALDNELNRYKEMTEGKIEELEKLQEAQEDMYEEQIESLKREQELYHRSIEDKKYYEEQLHDKVISDLEDQIEKNKEFYEVDGNLRDIVFQRMQEQNDKNGEFYQNLIQWNRDYGTGIDEDISKAWDRAYEVLDKYDYQTLTVKGSMELLAQKIRQAENNTANLEKQVNSVTSATNRAAASANTLSQYWKTIAQNTAEAAEQAKKAERAFRNAQSAQLDFERSESERNSTEIVDKTEKLKELGRRYNAAMTPMQRQSIVAEASALGYNEEDLKKVANAVKKNHSGDNYVIPDQNERKMSKALGLKSDEVVRILKTGEAVIPKEQNLQRLNSNSLMSSDINNRTNELSKGYQSYSTNNNSNINISIGDTIIQGNADNSIIGKLNEYKKCIINEVFSKINKHTDLSGFRSVKRYV